MKSEKCGILVSSGGCPVGIRIVWMDVALPTPVGESALPYLSGTNAGVPTLPHIVSCLRKRPPVPFLAHAICLVVALGLASGVWASHWELDVKEPVTYAEEIFGGADADELVLTLAGDDESTSGVREGTRVTLQLVLPEGTNVASGAQAEVTMSLSGAVFRQPIGWNDIYTGSDLTKVRLLSGRTGASSISVTIGTDSGIVGAAGTESNATVTFYISSIQKAGGLASGDASVTASASVVAPAGGDSNFPNEVENVSVSSNVIADSEKALTLYPQESVYLRGFIDPRDHRKLFETSTPGVQLASVGWRGSTSAKEADGRTIFIDGAGRGADIHIEVSGRIRPSDRVFVDLDGDEKMGIKEGFDIKNGLASKRFELEKIVQGASSWVYYVPDGVTHLRHGSVFNSTMMVDYDDASLTSPDAVTWTASLAFFGLLTAARAYAISSVVSSDVANIRIKCEADGPVDIGDLHISNACTIFLHCDGEDGREYFGEVDTVIGPGETRVLDAADVGDVIGVDVWTGGLSCHVLSYYYDVVVQVLVHSGGSWLNHTYIAGGVDGGDYVR